LYDRKQLGQKSGQGFYQYKGDKYERIDLSEEKASKYDPTAILGIALNNASWLISNEVCTKEDLDNALNLGMGHKTNLFELANKFGVQKIVNELKKLEIYGEFYHPNEYLLALK
jgi:enoyl-CoA hydratase / 3-hydroxyacyl-CoA dehydrogenase